MPNPPFANRRVTEKAPWRSLQSGVAGVYSLLEIPTDSCHFPSHLTPSSDPNSHFAQKALWATPGWTPGGLSGLWKRCFWKTVFLPPTENRWFWRKMAKMTIYILPTKTRGCAPQSLDKNDENGENGRWKNQGLPKTGFSPPWKGSHDTMLLRLAPTQANQTNKRGRVARRHPKTLSALKGTVNQGDRESPKRRFVSQKTADLFADCTPSLTWRAQETADFRRFSQETAVWAPSP